LNYKLQYIDRLKPKVKWYFSFGNSMHSCVEYFFKVNAPPPPSLDELLQFYKQNWLSQGYESPEEEARYKDYGRDILTRFWEIHSPVFRLPIALERSFYLDIDGIKVRGFIDRVDKLDSGGLSIIDYKTNKDLFTADYVNDDLQLTIYQMAAEQTWQLPVERLTLYHLRSNTPCSCAPRNKTRLEQARRLVQETADDISRGEFPATENQFCPCDFPEYCPYYKHHYMTIEPQTAQQGLMPGIAAVDAVERYADLQVQVRELQKQLEEARQTIIEYCQSEGLNRVYAGEHEITYKLIERTGFSEDEVRAVLEPEGMWEKVLGFDAARLKELLADTDVPAEVKDALKSLRHVTSTYPQLYLKNCSGDEDEE
jgi:putative RecB family exonuclease